MERKDPLTRVFSVFVACFLVFLCALGLLVYSIASGFLPPLDFSWNHQHFHVSRISWPDRELLLLKQVVVHGPEAVIEFPEIRLRLRPSPPFWAGVVLENPEIRVEKKGCESNANGPVRIPAGLYRLLHLLNIRNGQLQLKACKTFVRIYDLNLMPAALADGTVSFSSISANVTGRYDNTEFKGELSGRLVPDSRKASLLLRVMANNGNGQKPLAARVNTDFTIPESLDEFKADYAVTFQYPDLSPVVKELGIPDPVVMDGHFVFSESRGVTAGGTLRLPGGKYISSTGLPIAISPVIAYSITGPPDLSRLSLTLKPRKGPHSSMGLKAGYDKVNQSWNIETGVKIDGLSGSRDPDHAFEDLGFTVGVKLAGSIADSSRINWRSSLSWDKGQVLFYPWFLDLSELKGSLKASGSWSKKGLLVRRLSVEGPLAVDARDIRVPVDRHGDLSLQAFLDKLPDSTIKARADAGLLYNVLVRDPFSDSHPVLNQVAPAGPLRLTIMNSQANLTAMLDISLAGAPLLKGLDLNFPYPLREGITLQGSMAWKAFLLENLLPQDLVHDSARIGLRNSEIPLRVSRNQVVAGPVDLDLGTGDICLERAVITIPDRAVQLQNICIKDLQIRKLLRDFPYNMVVTANAINARLQGEKLVFSGQITASVAGGKVEASNIWLEPFGPLIRYGADIRFSGLDLEKLTEPTAFGVVTGVVKGWIKGLVMTGVQPEQFDFLLESDDAVRSSRKISLRAVENLSILGGGQGVVSLLGHFFKEFSYRKIGISCKLKNDVFVLHGLVRKGGKEYLVERGFWGGVNVVNMNPGGRIRFKDMVDRIKRITESGNNTMEVR